MPIQQNARTTRLYRQIPMQRANGIRVQLKKVNRAYAMGYRQALESGPHNQ